MNTITRHLVPGAVAAVAFALCGAMSFDSHAADRASGAAQARYQAEVAKCNNGSSNQDRATCMKEAGAALAEKKRGTLDEANSAAYDQNAIARCNALPMGDQADCKARIQAPTAVEGSVQSGGVLRESVTRTVGEPIVIVPVTPDPSAK